MERTIKDLRAKAEEEARSKPSPAPEAFAARTGAAETHSAICRARLPSSISRSPQRSGRASLKHYRFVEAPLSDAFRRENRSSSSSIAITPRSTESTRACSRSKRIRSSQPISSGARLASSSGSSIRRRCRRGPSIVRRLQVIGGGASAGCSSGWRLVGFLEYPRLQLQERRGRRARPFVACSRAGPRDGSDASASQAHRVWALGVLRSARDAAVWSLETAVLGPRHHVSTFLRPS